MLKIVALLLVSLALAGSLVTPQSSTPASLKAFVGARVFRDFESSPQENGVLLVRDGKVESITTTGKVPKGAEIIDLKGKVVIPGLISAHVHISDVQGVRPPAYTDENTLRQLGVFARYGITSVLSLGGEKEPAFRARQNQDTTALDRSRIYLSGDVIVGRTPEEARAMVVRVASANPDIIKIRVDDNLGSTPRMTPDVYRAVIDEAHRRGLRVAAHIYYLDDAKDLLRAGADFIAHSVRDKEIDDEFISLMKKRNIPYCPTLTREISTYVYETTPLFFKDPFFLREADREVVAQLQEPQRQEAMHQSRAAQTYKASLVTAERNLKKALQAGLLIVMGTDSGAFANRFEGYFEHVELEMMVAAGLTPQQTLRSATSDAARAMKVDSVGRLSKGAWADFVVLDADPTKDILNTRRINSVWIAGNRINGL
ncbi:MAG: amidohydrolase family protein [Acidobacteriota bacterium]